jgi:hypothetical protein
MMELQAARLSDVPLIFEALLKLLHKSPAPQMRLAEPEVAFQAMCTAVAEQRLYLYGDYALLVDVGSPWHSSKNVLIEEIIVRYQRHFGNNVESAIAQLEVLAERIGCVAIGAGDTQIGLMSPRYLAAGFTSLGTQFYKEIP